MNSVTCLWTQNAGHVTCWCRTMMDRCFDVVLSFNSRPNKYSLTNKTPCCHFYGAAVLKVDYRLIVVLVRRVLSLIVSVLPNEAALHQYQIAICIRSSLVRCVRVWRQSCNCSGRRPWRDVKSCDYTVFVTRCCRLAISLCDNETELTEHNSVRLNCVTSRVSRRRRPASKHPDSLLCALVMGN